MDLAQMYSTNPSLPHCWLKDLWPALWPLRSFKETKPIPQHTVPVAEHVSEYEYDVVWYSVLAAGLCKNCWWGHVHLHDSLCTTVRLFVGQSDHPSVRRHTCCFYFIFFFIKLSRKNRKWNATSMQFATCSLQHATYTSSYLHMYTHTRMSVDAWTLKEVSVRVWIEYESLTSCGKVQIAGIDD